MRPAVTVLTVLLLLSPGGAAAQTITRTTSPADTVERLLAMAAKAGSADSKPPTREEAVRALDNAIQVAKAFRGAEETRAIGGAKTGKSREVERGLRADRVHAAVADRPNEWTAALIDARNRISTFLDGAPECRPVKAPAVSPALKALTAGADDDAVTSWIQVLTDTYCHLGTQLKAVSPATGAGEHEASTAAATFLPFAGVSAGHTTPQVSAQLADLYFTNRWRLYLRSTFQAKKADTAKEASDDAPAGGGTDLSTEEKAAKIDDKVRNAMLDPFGGDLNLMAGYYAKIPTRHLEGDANDAEHGLFVDARAGLKLIELPEQTLTLNEGPSSVTPFYTASVGVRLRLPTYLDRFVRNRAGAAELAAVLATSGIVDRSASTLFSRTEGAAPLPLQVRVLHVSLGLDITDTVQLGLSGNVWSNTGLKKRVAVEFNVVSAKQKTGND